MKTYKLFGIMLVTGKPDELDKVSKLAEGTHFLTAYGDKRGKRGIKIIGYDLAAPEKEASHVSD